MTLAHEQRPPRPGFRVHSPAGPLSHDIALYPHPGITVIPQTWADAPDGSGPVPATAIVEFEPGASYPTPDQHNASSEVVIVQDGLFSDEGGIHRPGTVIEADRGTAHTPSSSTGCRLYVVFPDLLPFVERIE